MRKVVLLMGVAALWSMGAPAASAQTLAQLLPDLLKSDDRVRAAESDQTAAQEHHKEVWGDYYPEANITAFAGPQNQNKNDDGESRDSHMAARQFSLTINQLIYDFGKTTAKIDLAKLASNQADTAANAARQNLVLDAVTAYVSVMRATESVRYARVSEDNIRKQTGYEEARVERGGGYTTDVLQAKSQLAGAQARRVRAEGALIAALNRYRSVFHDSSPKVENMRWPALPTQIMPASVDAALEVAKNDSLVLKNEELKELTARRNADMSRASGFFPRVELVAAHDRKQDVDGIAGFQLDNSLKLQVRMPFNLGLTAVNSLKAAENSADAATFRLKNIQDAVEEQVRNAWQNLQTAQENAGFLRNQSNIAGEFLELARKERQLGTRSLLDVLSGETSYINALSDAIVAESDVLLATFQMLAAMGQLSPEAAFNTAEIAPGKQAERLIGKKS